MSANTCLVAKPLEGRPRFQPIDPVKPHADEAVTALFYRRCFTQIVAGGLVQIFQYYLQAFIRYFIASATPSPQTLTTFADTHSVQWYNSDAHQSRFLKYFNRFLHNTENTTLPQQACFQRLARWSEQFQKLGRMTLPPQKAAAEQKLIREIFQTISQLQNGEMCLLPAHTDTADPLYYLFVRTGESYTFKIIGRGDLMSQVAQRSERAEAGRTRIQSEIVYTGVPARLIQDPIWLEMLVVSPISQKNITPEKIRLLTSHFQDYLNVRAEDSSWVIKSDNPLKGLWSAVKALPMSTRDGETRTQSSQKRLQLQYRLFALLDQFEACHHHLQVDSEDYKALKSLLRSTSRQATMTYKKGFISLEELNEIRQELEVVQRTLKTARSKQISTLSRVRSVGSHLFEKARLSFERDVQAPHPIPEASAAPAQAPAVRREQDELPALELPTLGTAVHIPPFKPGRLILPQEDQLQQVAESVLHLAETATYATKKDVQVQIVAALERPLSAVLGASIDSLRSNLEAIMQQAQDIPPQLRAKFILQSTQALFESFFEPFEKVTSPSERDKEHLVKDALIIAARNQLKRLTSSLTSILCTHLDQAIKECDQMRLAGVPPAAIEGHILQALQDTPFFPIKAKRSFMGMMHDLDNCCLWNYLDDNQGVFCLERLSQLSASLMDVNMRKPNFGGAALEGMFKLSMMMTFLTRSYVSYRSSYSASCHNLDELIRNIYKIRDTSSLGGLLSTKTRYDHFERTGFEVTAGSSSFFEEFQLFVNGRHALPDREDQTLPEERCDENLRFLKKQEAWLKQISSDRYKLAAFFMPKQMERWAKKIRHPLLVSALRQIAMSGQQIEVKRSFIDGVFGAKTSDSEIEAAQKETNRMTGLKTQEAFVDNPQGVLEFFLDEFNSCVDHLRSSDIEDEPLPIESLPFSKEELTDLLLLLRKQSPQIEVLSFIEKHPTLLRQADIRNFLELVFFDPSLIEAVKDFPNFFLFLPEQLSELIQRSSERSEDLSFHLFLIEMTQRIAKLYQKAETFDLPEGEAIALVQMGQGLQHRCSKRLAQLTPTVLQASQLAPYRQRVLVERLISLLQQNALSREEVAEVILTFNLFHTFPGDSQDIHPQRLDFILGRYESFMHQLMGASPNAFTPILQQLLQARGYESVAAPWIGAFPRFQNGTFEFNLLTGQVIDLEHGVEHTKLPDAATSDPQFDLYFGDIDLTTTSAQLYLVPEATIYRFTDQAGRDCRIELSQGRYFYYRTFGEGELQTLPMDRIITPEKPPSIQEFLNELQLVILDPRIGIRDKIGKILSLMETLTRFINGEQIKKPHLPYILDRGVYVHPERPQEGLCFDEAGRLMFRIEMARAEKGLEIRSVHDCRSEEETGPWQVQSIETLNHPALNQLKKFESSDQIIVWGQEGRIQKIELPRYGMTFALENDALVFLDSRFKGYALDLNASIQERKGYEFSLLLRHPDREKPTHLILPSSDAIQFGTGPLYNRSTGIAKWIQYLRTLLELLIQKLSPILSATLIHQIESSETTLHPTIFIVRPHTGELIPLKGERIHSALELLSQALKLDNDALALTAFKEFRITANDLNRDNLKTIAQFLTNTHGGNGLEAALKIKLILHLKELTKSDVRLDKFRSHLDKHLLKQTKHYLEAGSHVVRAGQLSQEEVTEVAVLMQEQDPSYYQMHMRPFFHEEGEVYVFPELSMEVSRPPKRDEEVLNCLDSSAQSAVAELGKKKDKTTDLSGFNFSAPSSKDFQTQFLALYHHLRHSSLDSRFMQQMRWTFILANAGQQPPTTAAELCLDALYTVFLAREQDVDLSTLPSLPEYKAGQSEHDYKWALEPIVERIFGDTVRWRESEQTPIEIIKAQVKFPTHEMPSSAAAKAPAVAYDPSVCDERLEKRHQEILAERATQEISASIQDLEEVVEPERRLEDAELTCDFHFIEDGEPLLFTAETLSSFFTGKRAELPQVTIPRPDRELMPCEEAALEELQADMECYRKRAQKKMNYSLIPAQMKALEGQIKAKIEAHQKTAALAKADLDHLMHSSNDPLEHLEIMGSHREMATLKELKIALYRGQLRELQEAGRIPSTTKLVILHQALMAYFDAEVRLHLAEMAQETLCQLQTATDLAPLDRTILTNTLFAFLTKKRHYRVDQDPLLLFYEAFRSMTYRFINEDIHQLQFLEKLLLKPQGISTAITGAGKTILKLVEAMMKANGRNLVTMRFLAPLYPQSLALFKEILGEGFDTMVYPFRFNLKMPLKKHVKIKARPSSFACSSSAAAAPSEPPPKYEVIEESIFKGIYHDLLRVIHNRGCVVTDYKSLPLLAEKWIKLNREFCALRENRQPIPPIEIEHWHYLRQILILLANKEVSAMDEYDRQNHSKKRLQIQIGDPEIPAEFLWQCSLDVCGLLAEDPGLKLAANIQSDLPVSVRCAALERAANQIAAAWCARHEIGKAPLLDYFLGRSEAFLSVDVPTITLRDLDQLALYKDLFTTFLPISLGKASKDEYDRSEDGKRAVPSHEGMKQLTARFGTVTEDHLYLIQEFIQNQVSVPHLASWLERLKKEAETELSRTRQRKKDIDATTAGRQFKHFFPEHSLGITYPIEELQIALNTKPPLVREFLIMCLRDITVSASTVSFTPQNCLSRARATSGCSATKLEGLHRQFQAAETGGEGTLGEMVYRLILRTGVNTPPLLYDPENPMEMIGEAGTVCAVIDGASAFKDTNTQAVAEELMRHNPATTRVDFHTQEEGRLDFVGEVNASRPDRGFVYTRARARGFDYGLPKNGRALLTNKRKVGLQEITQHDGRLREQGQSLRLAVSRYTPVPSTEYLVAESACHESIGAAEHLYQAKEQELYDIVQAEAFSSLLACREFETTLDRSYEVEAFFIHHPEQAYQEPGSYWAKHKHIRRQNTDPDVALYALRDQLVNQAEDVGLEAAAKELREVEYPPELLRKMPTKTFGPGDSLTTGLELELEEEIEAELDAEYEMEIDVEENVEQDLERLVRFSAEIPFYFGWNWEADTFALASRIHPAFDPLLTFSENFLPITRTDPLFIRTPFDPKMNRLGALFIRGATSLFSRRVTSQIQEVRLCDSLDTVHPHGKSSYRLSDPAIVYDTRTNRVVRVYGKDEDKDSILRLADQLPPLVAQAKFFDGQYHDYQYTREEWFELERWLLKNNPRELHEFFVKEVLKSRQRELPAFEASPLNHLFQRLLVVSKPQSFT